jgi:hypothetical protein
MRGDPDYQEARQVQAKVKAYPGEPAERALAHVPTLCRDLAALHTQVTVLGHQYNAVAGALGLPLVRWTPGAATIQEEADVSDHLTLIQHQVRSMGVVAGDLMHALCRAGEQVGLEPKGDHPGTASRALVR